LIRQGYDLDRIAEKVAETYDMDPDTITSRGRQKRRVAARSLLCFWAVREPGMSLTALARHLGMSVPAVGYAVQRGEAIARDNNHQLIEAGS
jgi:chromosomal replication initiation ATPase DnaA